MSDRLFHWRSFSFFVSDVSKRLALKVMGCLRAPVMAPSLLLHGWRAGLVIMMSCPENLG